MTGESRRKSAIPSQHKAAFFGVFSWLSLHGRNIRRRQSIAFVRFVNPKSPRFHEFGALFFG